MPFFDITSRRAFLQVSISEGRVILNNILENTPYASVHEEFPKEEEE